MTFPAPTAIVTCPRCAGFSRAFARHSDVNGGRCLQCDGALVVPAHTIKAATPAGVPAVRKGRAVEVKGFGSVWIHRAADGSFHAAVRVEIVGWDGEFETHELPCRFDVTRGWVCFNDGVCQGLLSRETELRNALQSALRA